MGGSSKIAQDLDRMIQVERVAHDLSDLIAERDRLFDQVSGLQRELEEVKAQLWCAVKAAGGELKIPEQVVLERPESATVQSLYVRDALPPWHLLRALDASVEEKI
jgi:hypothetical protein